MTQLDQAKWIAATHRVPLSALNLAEDHLDGLRKVEGINHVVAVSIQITNSDELPDR